MRIRVLLAAGTLAVGVGLLSPAMAHAAASSVACTGTETVNYSPGLTLATETTTVSIQGILGVCKSSDSTVSSGLYTQQFSAQLSCLTALSSIDNTRVFQWNNGQTSTFLYNRVLNNVGGQTTVTFTGTITAGEFAGDAAVEQVVFATPTPLSCLATGGLTTLGPSAAVLTIG